MHYHPNHSCSISSQTVTLSQWTNMWVLIESLTGFTEKPFLWICLPTLFGIWIRSGSCTSMRSEKKTILQLKKSFITNIWLHQCHIFAGNRWFDLLLEIQLWRFYRWNGWTFISLDRLEWNCKLHQWKRNQS